MCCGAEWSPEGRVPQHRHGFQRRGAQERTWVDEARGVVRELYDVEALLDGFQHAAERVGGDLAGGVG